MSVTHYQEPTRRTKPNTFPLYYLGVLLVLAYSVFLVAHSVWGGVIQARALDQRQGELDQIKLEVAVQERYINYQKTDNYIEKQAREHFSYAKPGETIVELPQNGNQSEAVQEEQQGLDAQNQERVVSPHLHQWWEYFFGK